MEVYGYIPVKLGPIPLRVTDLSSAKHLKSIQQKNLLCWERLMESGLSSPHYRRERSHPLQGVGKALLSVRANLNNVINRKVTLKSLTSTEKVIQEKT